MQITINDKPREVQDDSTITDLLQQLSLNPRVVAITHNAAIIHREEYGSVQLKNGDQVQIITMFGGG